MAMKSFDNKHLEKWTFMKTLVDLQPNKMLCWTAITVLFVLHTGIEVVIT